MKISVNYLKRVRSLFTTKVYSDIALVRYGLPISSVTFVAIVR